MFREFKLHTHIESMTTETMKNVMVEIMVEVFGIFWAALRIMRHVGESTTLDARWIIADTLQIQRRLG